MSYRPGTILKRNEPQEDAYDEVRVIGQALVNTSAPRAASWAGSEANFWSITPTTFGSPVDKPLGELYENYTVVSEPDLNPKPQPKAERRDPGPAPEEAFQNNARLAGLKQSKTRVATPFAPQTKQEPKTAEKA